MSQKQISIILGTRPECIKMYPIIKGLRDGNWAKVRVVATNEQDVISTGMASQFNIRIDESLPQTKESALPERTYSLLYQLQEELAKNRPDVVLGQGDTLSALSAAMCASRIGIPFAHVEAGLRSGNLAAPFPEEASRVAIARFATLHFCPTRRARDNLLAEEVKRKDIFVVGNTSIDTLVAFAKRTRLTPGASKKDRLILFTHHRFETRHRSHDIFCAMREVIDSHEGVHLLFPIHHSSHFSATELAPLLDHPRIVVRPQLLYVDFIRALQSAYVVVTDSGGIQEEAPALGTPVLLIRNETERPEGV